MSAPEGWEDELNAAWGEVNKARAEAKRLAEVRDAIELLDRIYGRKAGHQLSDSGMFESWVDDEIAAFIRKHGSFPDLLREIAGA